MELHLIMDNSGTHNSAEVQRWLKPKKRQRFHFRFTPASSSWLNRVERFLALIAGRMIRGGAFLGVRELERAIYTWLAHGNESPTPFVWKAMAEVILGTVRQCKESAGTNDQP
jgi:transposase